MNLSAQDIRKNSLKRVIDLIEEAKGVATRNPEYTEFAALDLELTDLLEGIESRFHGLKGFDAEIQRIRKIKDITCGTKF